MDIKPFNFYFNNIVTDFLIHDNEGTRELYRGFYDKMITLLDTLNNRSVLIDNYFNISCFRCTGKCYFNFNCYNCAEISLCINCSNLLDSFTCIDCKNLSSCSICKNCNLCAFCNGCVNCRKCENCISCNARENVNDANDHYHYEDDIF